MNKPSRGLLAALLGVVALMAGCERPPMDSTQTGYRGTAMGQVSNPRIVGPILAAQVVPEPVAAVPSPPGSPLAKDVFKNVQVLGDLPVGEFTRTMLAITNWVSPKEGCAYCHKAGEDLSSDALYTKVVARKMLTMTRHLNADWQQHVKATGVTCYTCHRGQPVPERVWFNEPGLKHAGGASALSYGHNQVSKQAGLTSIDVNVLSRYLLNSETIRTATDQALPKGSMTTIRQTENTFGLMIHMSEALGVNCTHCHNTRSHAEWGESPLTRTQAFHGIQMARELNNQFMLPLTSTFPAGRLGPTGDVAKVNCATCHQGVAKPLNGVSMLKDHPALAVVTMAMPPAAAPSAPADAPADAAVPALGKVLSAVFFATDKDAIDAAGAKAIADAAAALKADPKQTLVLSGFADRTGNADHNLDLAKRRAFAVRDALVAAGIEAGRIQLKKPEFVIEGADASARRVDIVAAAN